MGQTEWGFKHAMDSVSKQYSMTISFTQLMFIVHCAKLCKPSLL